VTLSRDGEMIYTGDCRILREGTGHDAREFVLKPNRDQVQRFKAKEFRPERRELIPNPTLVIKHPLTGKTVSLKINDLSGTGFGVVEPRGESVLLPGMVLPEVEIHFTNRFHMMCKAQVIHRQQQGEYLYFGLGILDIDIQDHLDLVGMLYQAKDPDTLISNRLDLDALWDFFFETGFIYPSKYQQVADNKDQFKETYRKLYEGNPTIARHFTHMDHGQIQGHFSMLRLYEKTWVNQHHAALPHSNNAGLLVMARMTEFINEVYSLRSSNFLYSSGYYRSNNKFPVRFFGRFAKKMNNPEICSVDPFAFISFEAHSPEPAREVDSRWELAKTTVADLEDLNGFYNQASGGGMSLAATDMLPESLQGGTLKEEYAKSDFRRELHRISVRRNGELKAVIAVNITDVAMNLSELSNAVHIYIVDGSGFSKKDLKLIMSLIAVKFNLGRYPAMIYPCEFLEKIEIPAEKIYNLMTVNLAYWDDYMRYTTDFLKKAKLN
ncbi:MAG: PilZ domain-containing protein, partial [Desulfuromonadales bacterium]|nr:PilZ domain-containing protein [Desulfuromonadales bacterium]